MLLPFSPEVIGAMKASIALAVALTFQSILSGTGKHDEGPECRCLSFQSCWPSADTFTKLASQVSQPLLQPVPPPLPCYKNASSSACLIVQEMWTNGTWHSDQPGSMQLPNWDEYIFKNGTIDACYLNFTLAVPCEQGSVPVVGVDARTPADVQAAVKFAATHKLRVAVKNTGHDYLGRSTARGSFLIWTHYMKNLTYHDTLTPAGGPRSVVYSDAVTVGAGAQWEEVYAFVNARGRDIVGGISAGGSVGAAGGWLQGGGHSVLAPKYGLGVDNAIQITIVTENGAHLTTNAYQNADLFWALRGGGGGTFGVVTSVTYQTHPSTPLILAVFSAYINTTIANSTIAASPVLKKLFTEFVRMTPAMSDGGWAGYATILPIPPTLAASLQFFYAAANISWEAANATMNPFFEFAQDLAANSTVEGGGELIISFASTFPVDSFATAYATYFANQAGQVGDEVEIASRLLPRSLIEHDYVNVAETLLSMPLPDYYLVAGGAVAEKDPSSTGLNPAWRDALIHTVVGAGWAEGASSHDILQARDTLKQYIATLHGLAPRSGAYLNEASLYEIDFQYSFYGSHYNRLKSIKDKYDPAGLFIVPEGVGSEEWDTDLNCRR